MATQMPDVNGLPPGSRAKLLLPIRTIAGEETVMPVILMRGARPGPTLCVTAGVHGAEYNGIETATRIARDTDPSRLRGNLVVIPIVNVPAFEARSIYVCPNDGKNLNRVFPGRPDGTMSELLAHTALEIVASQAGYHVDLHAGDLVEAIEPMIFIKRTGVLELDRKVDELARVYGFENVVDTTTARGWSGAGTFSASACDRRVVSIAAEVGGQGILDERCVQAQLAAMRDVMTYLGLVEGEAGTAKRQNQVPALVYMVAPSKGMFYPRVALGERVQEGQTVAEITDYLGESLHTLRSPVAGRVLVVITSLFVAEKGLLMGFGPE